MTNVMIDFRDRIEGGMTQGLGGWSIFQNVPKKAPKTHKNVKNVQNPQFFQFSLSSVPNIVGWPPSGHTLFGRSSPNSISDWLI